MPKYYTINQAHQKLGCSKFIIYRYQRIGLIQTITQKQGHRQVAVIDEPTFQYLDQHLNHQVKNENLITIHQGNQLNRIANYTVLKQLLDNANIKPVSGTDKLLFGQHKLYPKDQIKQVCDDYLYPKNYKKYHQLTINTTQRDNPQTDLTKAQLVHRFNITNHTNVMQWLEYQRIHYHLNDHYELFFTPEDVTWFANHYRVIPEGYISNETIAQQFNRIPQRVSLWAKTNAIQPVHIIGYKKAFYQPEDAQILIQHFEKMNQKLTLKGSESNEK